MSEPESNPNRKRQKPKQPKRPAAAGSASCSEDTLTPPLDAADTAGWAELATSLGAMQRCALLSEEQLAQLPTAQGNAAIGRYSELGGSVVRLLLQSLELHRTLASHTESASFLARQPAEPQALTAADLISRGTSDALGGPLSAMQLPLYDRLAQAQQLGCLKFLQAMAAADRDDAGEGGAGGEGGESEEEEEEEEGAAAAGSEHTGAAFRDLYMQILAEGCGDELDALRREGGGRDGHGDGSESLSFLIDALEVGAETFSPIEKQLALASYGSPLSPDPAHAAAKRKAAEGAAQAPPAQPQEGGAPPKRPKPKGPKSPKAKPKGSASKERAAK